MRFSITYWCQWVTGYWCRKSWRTGCDIFSISSHLVNPATTMPVGDVSQLESKGKEEYSYSAFWPRWYTQSAQARITQFYLQITPCLPFLRERSPDVTTTATEAADIQLQLTSWSQCLEFPSVLVVGQCWLGDSKYISPFQLPAKLLY